MAYSKENINFTYFFVIDVIDLLDQGFSPETLCTEIEACNYGDKLLHEILYAVENVLGEDSIILISS